MLQSGSLAELIRNHSYPETSRPAAHAWEVSMGSWELESVPPAPSGGQLGQEGAVREGPCFQPPSLALSQSPEPESMWVARPCSSECQTPCGHCCISRGCSSLAISLPLHQRARPGLLTCGTALLSWHLLVPRAALIADDSAMRHAREGEAGLPFSWLSSVLAPGRAPQAEEGK